VGAAYLKNTDLPWNRDKPPAPKLPVLPRLAKPQPPQDRERELQQNLRTR